MSVRACECVCVSVRVCVRVSIHLTFLAVLGSTFLLLVCGAESGGNGVSTDHYGNTDTRNDTAPHLAVRGAISSDMLARAGPTGPPPRLQPVPGPV